MLDPALGAFHVAGAPDAGLLVGGARPRAADADERLAELKAAHEFSAAATFPFGAHVAVVEVDAETGQVELKRLVAVDDAGTLINPLIAEGQVHGGVATGVAQALYEEFAYDDDGNPMTGSFAGYAFPSAADLPRGRRSRWRRRRLRTRSARRASASPGRSARRRPSTTRCVDALAPYGVRDVDMPANGENVWRALQEAKA